MAKIRHLAIKTLDPEKLATFYEEVFDFKVLNRDETGAVYLSDGYLTLALLRNRGDVPSGLNHFGFTIEDTDEISEKLVKAGVAAPTKRPAIRPYAEHRATDPDGNPFDISVHGYDQEEYRAEREASAGKDKYKEIAEA
jgi:catechol-2,3-dioxygenase